MRARSFAPSLLPAGPTFSLQRGLHRAGQALLRASLWPFYYRSPLVALGAAPEGPLVLGTADEDPRLHELLAHLASLRRRLWCVRALLILARTLTLALLFLLATIALRSLGLPLTSTVAELGLALLGLWGLFVALRQRITLLETARLADRAGGLREQLATATELILRGDNRPLARAQIRRATDLAWQLDAAALFPWQLPTRDGLAVAATGGLVALLVLLASLRLTLPWGLPGTGAEVASTPVPGEEYAVVPATGDYTLLEYGDPAAVTTSALDELRRQLESQNLSPEEIAQRLAQAEQEILQRNLLASRQREALTTLAEVLSDNSVTADVAASLRKGEYEQAAQQMAEIGRQAQQLSPRARADLARKLQEAATRVAPANPDLAQRLAQAARSLAQGNPPPEQALRDLGEGIKQTAEAMRGQGDPSQLGDPGQALDPSQIEQLAGALPNPADMEALGDPTGDMSMLANGHGQTDPNGQPSATGGSGQDLAAGADGATTNLQPGEAAGGAGAGPGNPAAAAALSRLNALGKLLEIPGQASSGPGTLENDPRAPLVFSHDGSVTTLSSTSRPQSTTPINARGESNFVPWEKRPIVREYFSGSPAR